jgi:hypothetical protein
MFLSVGHYQRAFLAATEYACRQADQQQKLRELHDRKYTRTNGPELLSTPFSRMR